jgi:hypothetical protein
MPSLCPRDLAVIRSLGASPGTEPGWQCSSRMRKDWLESDVAFCQPFARGGRETSAYCLKSCATVNWRGTEGGSLHVG